jgi:flagellar hook-associated protein 2
MPSIQFGGVVSGLNTQSIIDALVAVEKQPLTALQNQEATLTAQKSSYATLGTAMDDLITKLKAFTVTNAGSSRAATPSNTSIMTAAATPSAAVASYQISVDRLATSTRAASTSAIGAAVTGAVNTSLTLNKANLSVPITAGNMALTVDGTTVQVAVGNPTTTTLQNVMDSLSSALQTQLQTTDGSSAVSASIVGGKLQLSITGNATAHTISFGDVGDTSNAATALGIGTQGVTGVQNATINATAYLDPTLASLNLPGSVTAGQISAVVDGVLVHYTVGDPTTSTMDQFMAGFGQAITGRLVAGGANSAADPTAVVTASIAGNRLQLAMSGAGLTHSISFGAASDASNALGMFGIASNTVTNATNPTLTGTTNLGVTRTLGPLDNAGLTGLTSTTTGVLTLNGTAINYDTTVDSLSTIISRINNSAAGVTASIDRTNDEILLTKKDTGAVAMDITDTSGTLGTALKLAPGTTNAQVIGSTSQVTIDGRVVTGTSNTVTGAIDGVTLNLATKDPTGQVETLNVGVDQTAVQTALTAFVASFNSLGDMLDSVTSSTPGTSGGTAGTSSPLSGDPTAITMFLSMRDTIFQSLGSGAINSMGALGLSTGAIGAPVGSTNRLQLDTTKLAAALASDPNAVANLLDKSTGPMASLLTQATGYEDPSNQNAYIQAHTTGLTSDISSLKSREADQQTIIDNYTTMIEAQYTAMETTLALLQSQSQQVAAQLGYTVTPSGSGLSGSSTSRSTSTTGG